MSHLSTANLATNTAWGDDLKDKDDSVFRVYGQNVNGLTLDRCGGQFDSLCKVLKETQADVMCGQEHQLDSGQHQVKSILYQTCRQHWQRSRMVFGTTNVPFCSMYKPGGTFMVAAGNVTGRIKTQQSDSLGRWVSQTFQGASGRRITIVSAYQVVSDVVVPGTTTAAAQQQSLLIQRNDPIQAPRKAFRRDLARFLQECQSAGDEIMLLGDFNEVMGDDPDGMTSIVHKLELFDMMSSRHSHQPPVTYSRGRRCLDYGLATPLVIQAITRCGYEAFHFRYPSDHRAYYFDLDVNMLFGTQIQPLSKFEPRTLYSTNVRQVSEYIRRKYTVLLACNAFERSHRLEVPGDRHAVAERLDSDVSRLSLSVEHSLTKFNAPAWSVALSSARAQEQALKKGLSFYRHNCPLNPTLINGYFELTGETFPDSLALCSTALRQIKEQVRTITEKSFEQRDKERDELIEQLDLSALSSDKKRATILRRIRYSEKSRQLALKLKAARTTQEVPVGMTRIEVPVHPEQDPKACTEWQLIDIPSEVLTHLQKRNRKHFSQAQGTPFTIPPLSTDLGFTGSGEAVQRVLRGQYHLPPEAYQNRALQLIIDHLSHTAEMATQEGQPTISEDEFIGKLKVWRESTSTSPSGLHLGHYKALAARHQYSEVDVNDSEQEQSEKAELDRMQRELMLLHLRMINYALARGYSYRRWQTVANSMIFKEPGNIKIHRTRVIHIYEADYNLSMGLKWRKAVFKAEELEVLNPGQYGGRTGCSASDPVLIEELQMDISRVTRKTVVQTNHDATSCYDRIIPNLAMVASQKFGVAATVTQACATTLENAEYKIRTDLGLAQSGYHHSPEHPIFGTGQGSAFSPAIWLFLSCILYDIYEKMAKTASYCAPDRSHLLEIGMLGFVDDNNDQTNCFLQDEDSTTLTIALQQTQHNAQCWNDLLTASGGALEIQKCSYHVVNWKFAKNGSPVLVSLSTSLPPVFVQDSPTSQPQQLQLLSPYTAHKTLGHFKEPAGTQKEQFRQLKIRIDETVAFLWKVPLSRSESWTFYFGYYLPSVTYPLSSSHFSRAQLDSVQKKAISILLARCGYNRNMKRAVVFGPLEYGGASFLRLYDHQGISQVTSFLRNWRTNNVVGQLLRVLVAWCNFSVGMSSSVVTDVYTPLPHLESMWIGSLREYLASVGAWFETEDTLVAPLERVNDDYIMERIVHSHQFTTAQIKTLNYCRLYLGALTLSDLTSTTGRYLDQAKLTGRPSLLSTTTTWLRIHQESPSESEWRVWKRANRLWSTAEGKMLQPLGPWTRKVRECRIQCAAYGFENSVAIKSGAEYEVCDMREDGHFEPTGRQIAVKTMPKTAVPVDVEEFGDDAWRLLKRTAIVALPPPIQIGTFPEFLDSLPPWEVDLLRHTELFVDPRMTCFSLQQQFFAGCDGSAKFGTQGAFGWSICTSIEERAATGMGPSRGAVIDSYRAECSGLLSLLRFLIRIAEFTDMFEQWSGVIGTDSQSMLDRVFKKQSSSYNEHPRPFAALDPLLPEWDLLVEIQASLHLLPGVSVTYVKAHQDDQRPVAQLPLMAQLNVEADALATLYQQQHGSHKPQVLMSPNASVHLVTASGTITAKHKTVILDKSTSYDLRQYIQEKNNWTDSTMDVVNWSAHGKAIRSKLHCRVHISKLLHECLPTFHQLNKFGGAPRNCMACGSTDETRDHIIRCVSPQRTAWRLKFWEAIAQFHIEYRTAPLLIYVFRSAMEDWLQEADGELVVSPIFFPNDVRKLILDQNLLGWRQLFSGRFSIEWSKIQHEYYSRHKTKAGIQRRTGSQWQVKLIGVMWDQWRIVWRLRNEEVHGHDTATRARAERTEIDRNMREVYDQRQHLEPNVASLLHHDEHEHRSRSRSTNQNWLAVNLPIIRRSVRRVKKRSARGMQSLRSYFTSVPSEV